MANYGWQDIDVLLVDGYNVQPMTVIDLQLPKIMADIEELPGAGDQYATKLPTGTKKVDGPVVLRMPLDDAAGGSYAAFVTAAHVTNGVVCIGLRGNTAAANFYGFKAHQLDYAQEPAPRQLTKVAATWEVNGQMHEGRIIRALASITADGDTESSPVDNAAASSGGGEAFVQIGSLSLDGHTNLAVKLRHSTDGVAWSDLVSFTAVTAARSGQQVAVSGTINRYVAASWDFTGAGTSPSATLFVGLKRY